MSKHFMSILGNSLYAVCDYTYENEVIRRTPYVQTAVIKQFMSELNQGDKITVFLTEDAEKKNWIDRPFSGSELNEERGISRAESNGYKPKYNKQKSGLGSELVNVIDAMVVDENIDTSKILNPIKQIPEGKSEEELWKLFSLIYNEIHEGDEIYFDITNSFRFMPMMVMTILNYAQTLKKINVKGIYYGLYVPQIYDYPNIITMPIIDLSMFQDIVDIAKASDIFVKNGIAEPIMEVTQKNCNNRMLSPIKESMKCLDTLTKCIQSGRGKEQKKSDQSIKAAYKKLSEKKPDLSKISNGFVEIIKPLFNNIYENVQRFDCDKSIMIGQATIEWCKQYHQIQQGFTALEETITTLACELCKADENSSEEREYVKGVLMSMVKNEPNNKKCPRTILIDMIPKDLAVLSQGVSELRNSLNHFGFDKKSVGKGMSYKTFEDDLKKFKDKFDDIVFTVTQS